MSTTLSEPIILPDSSASAGSEPSTAKKTRVPYSIDFTDKPSDQEISDYTLIGGNLLAINSYALRRSHDGEDFDAYEAVVKRITRYYANLLTRHNRARFADAEPDTEEEGCSVRRAPPPRTNRKRNKPETSDRRTQKRNVDYRS